MGKPPSSTKPWGCAATGPGVIPAKAPKASRGASAAGVTSAKAEGASRERPWAVPVEGEGASAGSIPANAFKSSRGAASASVPGVAGGAPAGGMSANAANSSRESPCVVLAEGAGASAGVIPANAFNSSRGAPAVSGPGVERGSPAAGTSSNAANSSRESDWVVRAAGAGAGAATVRNEAASGGSRGRDGGELSHSSTRGLRVGAAAPLRTETNPSKYRRARISNTASPPSVEASTRSSTVRSPSTRRSTQPASSGSAPWISATRTASCSSTEDRGGTCSSAWSQASR